MSDALSAQTIVGAIALALFAALPVFAPAWALADFAIYFTYAILAVSLAFVWGRGGLLSLGHAVYFGLGAYAMSLVTLGMVPGLGGLRSSWAGLAAGVAAGGGAAWALGQFFFAARGLKGAFFGVVTLALAVVFERLATNWDWIGGLNGLMNVPPLTLGLNGAGRAVDSPAALYATMLAVLTAAVFAAMALSHSPFGVALAAVRDNELRAATLGHDVRRVKITAFALSGALAGLAGALFVAQFGFASPSLIGFSLSADALIWTALGGRNAVVAAALGAIALRFVESRMSGPIGAAWPAILGVLFMLSVVLAPNGLIGEPIARLERRLAARRNGAGADAAID